MTYCDFIRTRLYRFRRIAYFSRMYMRVDVSACPVIITEHTGLRATSVDCEVEFNAL